MGDGGIWDPNENGEGCTGRGEGAEGAPFCDCMKFCMNVWKLASTEALMEAALTTGVEGSFLRKAKSGSSSESDSLIGVAAFFFSTVSEDGFGRCCAGFFGCAGCGGTWLRLRGCW
eukprot:TRINITY_DN24051_c0_g1_i1.p2 TRINITY_DN24051_c0_g1~~TRINITY_DN24051_c0_g1_i1.p2  ORF type:complete len:116 (-),score=10.81 TRINITY_DN24051_c0_g1_i1:278-625(-)